MEKCLRGQIVEKNNILYRPKQIAIVFYLDPNKTKSYSNDDYNFMLSKNHWRQSLKNADLRPKTRITFQPKTRMSRFINNAKVAFFDKREGRVLWQTRKSLYYFKTRTSIRVAFSTSKYKHVALCFNTKREPVSSSFSSTASLRQAQARVLL